MTPAAEAGAAAEAKVGAPTRRIVVGVDGSPSSNAALEWAVHQAKMMTGSSIEAMTTWEWPTTYGIAMVLPDDFDPSAVARTMLDGVAARTKAAHPEVELQAVVVEGHPALALVEASAGAELLVVGCRGHGEFAGMLLGSVSEHCAAHAHCPVVVWRGGR